MLRVFVQQVIQMHNALLVVLVPVEYLSQVIGISLNTLMLQLDPLLHLLSQVEQLFLDQSLHEAVVHVIHLFLAQ